MSETNRSTQAEPASVQVRTNPPTSADVARLANVSRATVSYVLNNVPDARVSEATKERVWQAAEKLGYVPHEIASSLRSGRSDLVLLPFFDWPYNQSSITYLQALAQQIDQLGYTVMLRFFGRRDQKMLARKIAAFHPIGVIVGAGELTHEDVALLARNGVKAILAYEGGQRADIPTIGVDFTSVGEHVGRYFVSKGYRPIAAIVPQDPRIIHLGLQRLEGLAKVGLQYGIPVQRIDLDFEPTQAAMVVEEWRNGSYPRAIFTYNDEYGMLLMSALQDSGFNIPGDIALVGCDDLAICELLRPRLTSVNLSQGGPERDIAAYLDDIIQGREPQTPPHMPVRCKIIMRESG